MIFPPALQAKSEVRQFIVPNASPLYSVAAEVRPGEGTSDDIVIGPGKVTLVLRSTKKPVQTIPMSSLAIFPDAKSLNVGGRKSGPELYGTSYSFVFQDFDFDGRQDLAICKNLEGSYGGPAYDVFLWKQASRKFVRHALLTKISTERLGLVHVDRKARELVTFEKSGAAWHKVSMYRWKGGRLTLVKDEVDDATGEQRVVTTRVLRGAKWRVSVKRLPLP